MPLESVIAARPVIYTCISRHPEHHVLLCGELSVHALRSGVCLLSRLQSDRAELMLSRAECGVATTAEWAPMNKKKTRAIGERWSFARAGMNELPRCRLAETAGGRWLDSSWNGAMKTLATGSEISLVGTGPLDRKRCWPDVVGSGRCQGANGQTLIQAACQSGIGPIRTLGVLLCIGVPVYFGTFDQPCSSFCNRLHTSCIVNTPAAFAFTFPGCRMTISTSRCNQSGGSGTLFLGTSRGCVDGCGGMAAVPCQTR